MRAHLLVIGGQRCGTTYLSRMLDAHPSITMARPAWPEPKVFLSDALCARGHGWYDETYFAHVGSESVLGEKSTSYIEDPKASRRAAAVLGEVQVLALLRDPVDRAISNWRFSTDNGFEGRPLDQALEENLDRPRPWDPDATSVSPFAYLERGRYADHLGPWLEAFPQTVHIYLLDDLIADDDSVGRLYADLGVDAAFRPEGTGKPLNRSTEPVRDLDADLLRRLRAYYQDADAALRVRLGRELPWVSA